jgi:hypothetical protein
MLEKPAQNNKPSGETNITFTPEEFLARLKDMKTKTHRTPEEQAEIQVRIDELEKSLQKKEKSE